jgi:CubicO group peptidase (beta-lactamase class C family)
MAVAEKEVASLLDKFAAAPCAFSATLTRTLSWLMCCLLAAPLQAASIAPADYIAMIESAQRSQQSEFDGMTLEQMMQKLKTPGVSIAVIKDFQIHWTRAYGVADIATGQKVDTNTLFQAASISKPVTAMALMKAVQEKKLGLDEDINSITRSWKIRDTLTKDQPVTPRSLASHTSGLGDGFGFPGYSPATPLPTALQILDGQAPSNTGPVRMDRPPMQSMKYSGGGFVLLQLALTEKMGKPFPDLMRDSVLDPIGMTNSTFEQPLSPERSRNAARGHGEEGVMVGRDKWHVYPELAAAGLWTTATDLAKFAIDLQKAATGQPSRVLSRASATEMLTPVGTGFFGIGVLIENSGQGWYFEHMGGNWGYICLMRAHKLKGYGVVVMTNADSGPLSAEILKRVESAYSWDSLEPGMRR